MLEPNATKLAVALARAGFAAAAVAKLARALREAGVIDDMVIGELAGVTKEGEWTSNGNEEVAQAMAILRAQLGVADDVDKLD